MAAIGREGIQHFQKITASWDHQPDFAFTQRVSPKLIEVKIFPYGEHAQIFEWTDKGTKPHEIRPKPENKRGLLIFQTGYSARTAPIARFDVGSGTASGEWRAAASVQHPGTEARQFTQDYTKKIQKTIQRRTENTIRRGLRRAHSGG